MGTEINGGTRKRKEGSFVVGIVYTTYRLGALLSLYLPLAIPIFPSFRYFVESTLVKKIEN